jgi:hypothetical protein
MNDISSVVFSSGGFHIQLSSGDLLAVELSDQLSVTSHSLSELVTVQSVTELLDSDELDTLESLVHWLVSQTPVMLSADQLQMGVMHSSAVLFNTETTSVLDFQLLSFQVLDFLQDFILLSLGNVEWLWVSFSIGHSFNSVGELFLTKSNLTLNLLSLFNQNLSDWLLSKVLRNSLLNSAESGFFVLRLENQSVEWRHSRELLVDLKTDAFSESLDDLGTALVTVVLNPSNEFLLNFDDSFLGILDLGLNGLKSSHQDFLGSDLLLLEPVLNSNFRSFNFDFVILKSFGSLDLDLSLEFFNSELDLFLSVDKSLVLNQ